MNLTKPQMQIYDMERFAGETINVICGSMLLHGEKSEIVLTTAVNRVFQLNDALRIRISEEDGHGRQYIAPYTEKIIEVLHFHSKDELDSYAQNCVSVPFDLYGDLCNIKVVVIPGQYGILVKFHHIVGDAWTIALIGTQFNTIINGEEPSACSYCEYVESESAYLESQRFENDRTFFLEQFRKCDEVTYLSDKQASSYTATRKTFVLNNEKTQQIKNYATRNKTSVYTLFMAALAVYMSRTRMNAEKFYLGTAVLNRSSAREKRTMGMFVNTVPLLMELENDKSFAENLAVVGKSIFSAFRHQKFNYGDVLSAIRKEHNFTEKLYDVMLSYQNATITGGNCETTWYHCGMQNESLQIHIDDRDNDGILRIHYDFQIDKFTEWEIDMLHRRIETLLFDVIENDSKRLYELELLTADEKQRILYEFNDTFAEYPRDKCVHKLFEDRVKERPGMTAVIACDRTMTYNELNDRAEYVAHNLVISGIAPNDVVAIILPRNSSLLVTIFGIMKAGAAYFPIDPNYPEERIQYLLQSSNVKLCITEEMYTSLCKTADFSSHMPAVRSNNFYCVLHTSGSTGKPKCLLLRHQNLVNCLFAHRHLYAEARFSISLTNVTFDAFFLDTIAPIILGIPAVLATDEEISNQHHLETVISAYPNSLIAITPTKLSIYIANSMQKRIFENVRVFISGGESFAGDLLEKLQDYTHAQIINSYGPAETTCGVTYDTLEYGKTITVGKPVANTQIYIVDSNMQIVPLGVTGELCIAGAGVGAGYLNHPELTAEKFIDNPFGEGKLYKTGDLAYWREDGNIVYVGRNDFQVKIRGLRVELGEIENAISGVDGISQSVVVVRKNNEGRQLICAFYTGEEVDAKEIRNHIGKKLPKYMLPHIFTHLDAMPLTTSGKVNRQGLPEVELDDIANEQEYVAPVTHMQKELCKLLEVVLSITPIGLADNFFDLGGDSLKAIEYVSKAHSEGIYFNLQNVFDYPAVGELTACIENGNKQAVSFADVDFSEIDKLLARNTVENISAPTKHDVGNILLAGATGFLGIHILADYLEHDTGTAYCLVRGRDKADSVQRLKNLLQFYFGNKYSDMDRIEVVCADLQKDLFGLSQEEYEVLLSKVDMVINTAASVKHYGSYQYFYEANVETTKRLIDFCKQSGAKLIHTSTLSVSGNSFGDQFDGYISGTEKHFYESSLYIEQPLENVYARSKFEGEKAVLDAAVDGLQVNIMRMGNLTNRLSDGMFQRNHESNAFLQRVKAILDLGVFPDYLMPLYSEFTPIDEAANAIMTIARHFQSEHTVFHINSTEVVYMNKLLEYFRTMGFKMDIVSGSAFAEILRKTAQQSGMKYVFETFINDMDENEQLNYDSNIRIENKFTVRYLKALGFEWADIGMEYLRKYVAYFKKIGYLR